MASIPERLRINGRAPVNRFGPDEKLFRRVSKDDWPWNDDTIHFLISIPLCTARSGFCEGPRDVLCQFEFVGGVISWIVEQIPSEIRIDPGNFTLLRIEHVPENDFYPHSEVRTYRSETDTLHSKPTSKTLKLKIRRDLAKLAATELLP